MRGRRAGAVCGYYGIPGYHWDCGIRSTGTKNKYLIVSFSWGGHATQTCRYDFFSPHSGLGFGAGGEDGVLMSYRSVGGTASRRPATSVPEVAPQQLALRGLLWRSDWGLG